MKEENIEYKTLKDFYPYYLSQHQNKTCRRLHFLGTAVVILFLIIIVLARKWQLLPLLLICGYLPAWVGHFVFEKNRPATFKYPFKSLICDFFMFFDILRKKISW